MKFLYLVVFLTAFNFTGKAQISLAAFDRHAKILTLTVTQRDGQLKQLDLAKLFTYTDNSSVYGFIGKERQRLRIKFITVIKDTILPNIYHIYGKSMVKNNVDEFIGTIKITRIQS